MNNWVTKASCLLFVVMLASALGMNYCIDQFFPMYSQVNGVLYFVALFFSLFGLLTFLLLNDRKDDSIKYSRMFLVLKGVRLFLSVIAVLYRCKQLDGSAFHHYIRDILSGIHCI